MCRSTTILTARVCPQNAGSHQAALRIMGLALNSDRMVMDYVLELLPSGCGKASRRLKIKNFRRRFCHREHRRRDNSTE